MHRRDPVRLQHLQALSHPADGFVALQVAVGIVDPFHMVHIHTDDRKSLPGLPRLIEHGRRLCHIAAAVQHAGHDIMHSHVFDGGRVVLDIRLEEQGDQGAVEQHQHGVKRRSGPVSQFQHDIAEVPVPVIQRAEHQTGGILPHLLQCRNQVPPVKKRGLVFPAVPDTVEQQHLSRIKFPFPGLLRRFPADRRIHAKVHFPDSPALHKIVDLLPGFLLVADACQGTGEHADTRQNGFHIPALRTQGTQLVVHMFKILGAAAALAVDRDGGKPDFLLRRRVSVDPVTKDIDRFARGAVNRPADGGQAAHDGLAQRVKPGDGHIPRHADTVLVETLDHAQRHIIVGAEHRVRNFAAALQDGLGRLPAADACPLTVKNHPVVQLQVMLPQHFPAGFQARPGNRGVRRPADEGDAADAVLRNQMLCQFADADFIVEHDAGSTFLRNVNGYVRLAAFAQRSEHFQHL